MKCRWMFNIGWIVTPWYGNALNLSVNALRQSIAFPGDGSADGATVALSTCTARYGLPEWAAGQWRINRHHRAEVL